MHTRWLNRFGNPREAYFCLCSLAGSVRRTVIDRSPPRGTSRGTITCTPSFIRPRYGAALSENSQP